MHTRAYIYAQELRGAYSKLHVWNLTEYSAAVYLDADLLVLRCPHLMFQGARFTMGSWPFTAQLLQIV